MELQQIAKEIPAPPYVWSGANAVPALGDKVTISFNELNTGTVVGYQVTSGYLGVWVQLDKNPAWRERAGYSIEAPALVYGAEIMEQRVAS